MIRNSVFGVFNSLPTPIPEWKCPDHDQTKWYCIKDGERKYHMKRYDGFRPDPPKQEPIVMLHVSVYDGASTHVMSEQDFEVWRKKWYYPFDWAQQQAKDRVIAKWKIFLK